ncbi:MAG: IS1634 family transposase [Bacilli bacterium]
MRLSIVKSKNATQYYVIKSFRNNDGKNTSKIVEKLGNEKEVIKKANGEDPITWAKKYIEELNKKEKENNVEIIAKFSNSIQIERGIQKIFNGGYLFLQDIYYGLKLDKTCKKISNEYKFEYDLNSILSRLIYTRILEPSSKLSSLESAKKLIEQPNFELQHIYRALEVIAAQTDFIEAEVYKNSLNLVKRNTKILYYDCTNYFFETEQAEGIKQYGVSKEHRPSPIVQMGLFMDGNGFPLAFCINPGNTNEQTTLKPLEKQIIEDFELSHFVVCTDAGLASHENRAFNNLQNRSFIVTQSLKKIKGHLKEWALGSDGWHTLGSEKNINLNNIDNSSENDTVYYKERWIKENGLEQRLIVSYSPKYAAYQRTIRNGQIVRAENLISNPSSVSRNRQNDPKRFISTIHITGDGEVAEKRKLSLNSSVINQEAVFDGFYAVCTTLEDDIAEILKINKRRWEIEESFRILKTEFKARPVYLKNDDRIKAHFTICFLSLLIYRILENKLGNKYTSSEIIKTLKDMQFAKLAEDGYIPMYERSILTDSLHAAFKFNTDKEIILKKDFKKIVSFTKK